MNDIISNMGDTVFAVVLVLAFVLFAVLIALVRASRAKEHLKSIPLRSVHFVQRWYCWKPRCAGIAVETFPLLTANQ